MTFIRFIFVAAFVLAFINCKSRDVSSANQSKTIIPTTLNAVDVFGEKLYYLEQGQGDPIILIHGAIGDYRSWRFQIDTLSTSNRVISISRRYAWPNNQPGPNDRFDCSVSFHAKDIVEFMNQLNIDTAHIMGHSYGAMIALRVAIDRPDKVKSLVLGEPVVETIVSGTKTGDSLIVDFRKKTEKAVDFYRNGNTEKSLRWFLTMVLGEDIFDQVPTEVQNAWLQNMVEGICIADTRDMSSISKQAISNIEIPTLLISGTQSPMLFQVVSDSLNKIIPNSSLKKLPNTSHGLQGENPIDFNFSMLNFLKNLRCILALSEIEANFLKLYVSNTESSIPSNCSSLFIAS